MNRHIALVGCGAIAQLFYLPAIAKARKSFDEVWLVDPNERAVATANSIVEGKAASSLSTLPDHVELIVIAAPNGLHFPLAQDALARNAHVLLEKPFTIWPDEARALVEAAAERRRIVAVNQTRRFMPYMFDLRKRVSGGAFGRLRSIVHYEGYKLAWPFESGAAFARTARRTGVIMDAGVHVLDFYQYLFDPKWKLLSAIHDGYYGPEGLAELKLEANMAQVSIRLSRYQKQSNKSHLVFDNAEIEIDVDDLNRYTVKEGRARAQPISAPSPVEAYSDLAETVLADFISAAETGSEPLCPAASSLPVIELLDEVYRSAKTLPYAVGSV